MTPRARWIVLAFALVGLGFASTSAWVHYRLLTDPTYVSPCDVNATFNCTQAYLSSYGSIRGVPVALGGVIWFALVALLAAFARPSAGADRDPIGGYIFALSTIGLAVVLYLGHASFFRLKTLCLLCLGTYASVAGIFITSGLTSTMSLTRLPLRLGRDLRTIVARPLLLVIAVLFMAGAASAVALFPREQPVTAASHTESSTQQAAEALPALPPDFEAQFADAWSKQPRLNLGVAAGTAKVVIVKFNDWLCPSCKAYVAAYEPVLMQYEKTHPGAVKVVVKDFPWSTECNYTAQQTIPGHESSCYAAAAVRMARDRGKEQAMIDWLFNNQQQLVEANLAGGAGSKPTIKAKAIEMLGVTDFDREYQTKLADIKKDVSDGAALQVDSTPSFFINGVRATAPRGGGNLQPAVLALALKLELARTAAK
jgi:uncharacterized membrane protein/protein-disulfide isomerase